MGPRLEALDTRGPLYINVRLGVQLFSRLVAYARGLEGLSAD